MARGRDNGTVHYVSKTSILQRIEYILEDVLFQRVLQICEREFIIHPMIGIERSRVGRWSICTSWKIRGTLRHIPADKGLWGGGGRSVASLRDRQDHQRIEGETAEEHR